MEKNPQKASGSAALSLALVVGSLAGTFTGHPFVGLLAAIAGIPLAILGMLLAASPRIGGGLISVAAAVVGVMALVMAFLGMIGVILF